jgi:excisionase family DNA binding protein
MIPSNIPFPAARSFYKVAEVANIIGISRTATYELVKSGEIRSVEIRGATRVSRGAIIEFVERVEASASPNPAA